MTRDLGRLTDRTFDLVVIGGGITGACIAHDATLRGLSVALVEADDFGAATSAASSKLLHGGIRYLQQLQFGKVRESASERGAFLRIAPHLVRWLPFLIPTTRSLSKGRLLLGAGVTAYRALIDDTTPAGLPRGIEEPAGGFVSREELLGRYPILTSLGTVTGAWVIHEAHMQSSERMTLAFVKAATGRGAIAANHLRVSRIRRAGARVTGVDATDRFTGTSWSIEGRLVVNAAGPWLGQLNADLGAARLERDITAFSKGVHLVTRPLLDDVAVAIPTHHQNQAVIQRGGRHFFVIPWRGRSLIGTANLPFAGDPADVDATRDDVSTFLCEINEALPGARLGPDDVDHAFAGLYPLTEDVIRPEVYQGTGSYQLVDHAADGGLANLVSVLGAKYTTARRLAEQAVDLAVRKLGLAAPPCQTRATPLPGGAITDVERFRRDVRARYRDVLPADVIDHLLTHYGTEIDAVIDCGRMHPTGLARVCDAQPAIEAEVHVAVASEMAVTLADVVFRRTGLGTAGSPGPDALGRCASIMATALGWSEDRRRQEVTSVTRRFESFRI